MSTPIFSTIGLAAITVATIITASILFLEQRPLRQGGYRYSNSQRRNHERERKSKFEESYLKLLQMGFDSYKIKVGLEQFNGKFDRCLNWLLAEEEIFKPSQAPAGRSLYEEFQLQMEQQRNMRYSEETINHKLNVGAEVIQHIDNTEPTLTQTVTENDDLKMSNLESLQEESLKTESVLIQPLGETVEPDILRTIEQTRVGQLIEPLPNTTSSAVGTSNYSPNQSNHWINTERQMIQERLSFLEEFDRSEQLLKDENERLALQAQYRAKLEEHKAHIELLLEESTNLSSSIVINNVENNPNLNMSTINEIDPKEKSIAETMETIKSLILDEPVDIDERAFDSVSLKSVPESNGRHSISSLSSDIPTVPSSILDTDTDLSESVTGSEWDVVSNYSNNKQ